MPRHSRKKRIQTWQVFNKTGRRKVPVSLPASFIFCRLPTVNKSSYCIIWTTLSKWDFVAGCHELDPKYLCGNIEHKERRSFSSSASFTFEPLAGSPPSPPKPRVDPSASTAAVHATFSSAHRNENRRGRRPDRSCPTCKASVMPWRDQHAIDRKGQEVAMVLAKLILQNRSLRLHSQKSQEK